MEEACPICARSFPVKFLERHVNSCLDTLEVDTSEPEVRQSSPVATQDSEQKSQNAFAALGLKADSGKSASEKSKKASATLTSILLAEKRLKRRQEELESRIRKKQAFSEKAEVMTVSPDLSESQVEGATLTEADSHNTDSESRITNDNNEAPPTQPDSQIANSFFHFNPSHTTNQKASTKSENDTAAADSARKRWKHEFMQLKREADLPLAQRLRPKSLSDFHGQEKLVGENGILRNLIEASQIPSFILWGVPGVGKTSLARIISSTSNHKFVELSGSESNAKKLKEEFANAENEKQLTGQKTILFLDEIHRFNKAVQDLLLPVIEKGAVTVIGATTENPSFTLNNALLSRMHTFVMEPLPHAALVKILNKGLLLINKTRKILHNLHLIAMSKDAVDYIATLSTGDSRVALNILESVNAYLSGLHFKVIKKVEHESEILEPSGKIGVVQVTLEKLKPLLSTRNFHQMYDKTGDNHYDAISAFHKSIRGSDADAAIFYLVKMLRGGEDPLFIARRMIVIASEDVGLRDSSCLPFAIAAMEAIQFVGMPEGEIVLAHCAVKLARARKSTKSYRALRKAQGILSESPDIARLPIPMHLRNAPTKLMQELGYGDTYKYNPNFKDGLVKQEFLPAEIRDTKLVDEMHLGTSIDDGVSPDSYNTLKKCEAEYNEFKSVRQKELKTVRATRSKKRRKQKATDSSRLLSSPVERLASYDENLSRHDQPEYFDGSEYAQGFDDVEANETVNCSYDEFIKEI